ncbi:hypothetical protein [Gordonia sp. WA4-43]|uniref:DUF7572 family protein n=1 Tax=Gordonia sp. WA4-43 TaxID=2878678 RepID=UPI001CFA8F17|nr:hypothetical protein [Gordonia sp. WA4-43]UCZ88680.1 hypothetical protein LEL84_16545 [Gordonia sp. WA4-43]
MRVEYVQDLPWHPPTTKLYRADDGTHLAVLVVDVMGMSLITNATFRVQIEESHIQPEAAVFHADENGALLDADGNLLNGLTPYASTDPESDAVIRLDPGVSTHAEAIVALGYTLVVTPEES